MTAYPPQGVPYLVRQTPFGNAIKWQEGDTVRRVDMSLPRGVLVRGNVVEQPSGKPVSGASVQYIAESANNPNTSDSIVTGWQAVQLSDERGEFEIAVLPGPGRLLVNGPQQEYIIQEVSSMEANRGKKGGQRIYAHAIQKIDPEKDAEPIQVTVSLQRGRTVAGRIVDEQGQSIDEALVISHLVMHPYATTWRGQMPPTLGGKFELACLEEGQDYTVSFLDAKRRLGTTLILRASDDPLTVVLKPCGEARARFLGLDGQPLVGFRPGLDMVVRPGAHEYDFDAAKRGELLADADSVSNIDRTDYWPGPETDDQGQVVFPALIPGATYRFASYVKGKPKILKEFAVQPGEQVDLGDLTVDLND